MLNVLHNEFPFLKMNNVGNLLRTIIQLEKANLSKKSGFNYQVDLGTLEHLSATAAKKGRSDVILLVWEYMEVMRLSEENSNCITLSQSMHESAAQAFACSSKKEDHMIFNLFALALACFKEAFYPLVHTHTHTHAHTAFKDNILLSSPPSDEFCK